VRIAIAVLLIFISMSLLFYCEQTGVKLTPFTYWFWGSSSQGLAIIIALSQ